MKFFLSDEDIEKLAEQMGFLKDKESEQLSLFDSLPKSSIQQAGNYIGESFSKHIQGKFNIDCEHNWETYTGLNHTDIYCTKCAKVKK